MKIRKSPHRVLLSVIGLAVLPTTPQFAGAQVATSAASSTPQTVLPVVNPCPRFAPGSVIHQPQALFSQNGVLCVQFSYQTTTDSAGRTLYCFMAPSGMENPTLHVKPGEHLVITVTNNTPDKGFMMKLDAPNSGPGPTGMAIRPILSPM